MQCIPVWVHLRNIPGNHRTLKAIKDLGGFAGRVIEVVFDPLRVQSREYVRVRVRMDVTNQVRRTKVVNLPFGGQTTVLYDFERLQKRCYNYQRLTHEQEKCPILNKDIILPVGDHQGKKYTKGVKEPVLKKDDPCMEL